ncbi:gamma-glutamyl-gamma-aminobutyrate hydrolase family protein [Schaalia vaccimaxillae]|uniref:gamma-glutamyl-gamma-aminobutyrate hydrolase family protein n=1 Tax=Schaalia vaccimaxillae TaxID=183916 RepID=UPI0003B55DDD|nr:gamma-glutamyl-gamma-aminobutyrate hydrolase family protein [Schaalia vaccimaxillae]
MTSEKPTLLISNVLPDRPWDDAYNVLVMCLWDRIIEAAGTYWNIIRHYAQLDGAEGSVLKAQQADAIVIMGGEDIHPCVYSGEQGYEGEGRHWYRADLGQIELVRHAISTGTPLVGICRGMQLINVALGGSLVQHIENGLDQHLNPEVVAQQRFARHGVQVEEGSALEKALGSVLDAHRRVEVSSAHHQCIDQVADELKVSARAEDSTIEAIEHQYAPVLGVQWHPEDPAADLEGLQNLLEYLAQACVPRLQRKATTLVA